jgi:hypothetical protein
VLVVFIVVLNGGKKNTAATTLPSPAVTPIPTSTVYASPSPATNGPENEPVPKGPVLASTATAATGQIVDGINCQSTEQFVEHIHAHLVIYVNGQPQQVPVGIGIPGGKADSSGYMNASGNCIYWLHTHASDGIIHIEAPTTKPFSLGNFFDEWGQPLTSTQVGPASGQVTAFYNGKIYTGSDLRNIPLTAHANIQLDVGNPIVAPETITSWGSL